MQPSIDDDMSSIFRHLTAYQAANGVKDRIYHLQEVFHLLAERPQVISAVLNDRADFASILRTKIDTVRASHQAYLQQYAALQEASHVCHFTLSEFSEATLRAAFVQSLEHDAEVLADYYRMEVDMQSVESYLLLLKAMNLIE